MQSRMYRYYGFTLVELLVVIAIIGILVALLLPAIQSARESSRRNSCLNNLRQLSLAVMNFEGIAGHLPPSSEVRDVNVPGNNGSWGVHGRILPFLEEGSLFQAVDLAIAWDAQMVIDDLKIPVFACPSDPEAAIVRTFSDNRPSLWPTTYGFNFGTWFVYDPVNYKGGNGVFYPDSNLRLASIVDGTSKTLMVSEVKAWTAYNRNGGPSTTEIPEDVAAATTAVASGTQFKDTGHTEWPDGRVHHTGFTATLPPNTQVPLQHDGQSLDGDFNSWQEGKLNGGSVGPPSYAIVTSRSHHPGGVNSSLMDGSVRFIREEISMEVWRAMATRADGEIFAQ